MKSRVPRVVALTGAGISADSGLATFRGAGGLWEGRNVEEIATPEAWAADPRSVWRFYQERRAALGGVQPNPAHRALVELEQFLRGIGGAFTLITQNVDDLHERAGSQPIHMHGELLQLRCENCEGRVRDAKHFACDQFLPCAECGYARLRPDIVWFGEIPFALDLIAERISTCTHFLSIGTSGVVYPASGLLSMARASGASTFVNSLDEPENLNSQDHFLAGRAAQVLPQWVSEWMQQWSQ